jgi:hypothetical protein
VRQDGRKDGKKKEDAIPQSHNHRFFKLTFEIADVIVSFNDLLKGISG